MVGMGVPCEGAPISSPSTRAGASSPSAPSPDRRPSAPSGAAAAPRPRVPPYQLHQEGGHGPAGPAEGPGEAEQPRAQRRLEQDEDGAGGGEPGRGEPSGAPRRRQQGPAFARRPLHRGASRLGCGRGSAAPPQGPAGAGAERWGCADPPPPRAVGRGRRGTAGGGRGKPWQELTRGQPRPAHCPRRTLRALPRNTAAPSAPPAGPGQLGWCSHYPRNYHPRAGRNEASLILLCSPRREIAIS